MFKKLNIDIEQFRYEGFEYPIDLIPYFKKELKDFIQNSKQIFKNALFEKAKENAELQKNFITSVDEFENYASKAEYENSVNFDIKQNIFEQFGKWSYVNAADADKEYSKSYEEMNSANLYKEEISNDTYVQTMIYFHEEKKIKDWLENMIKENEQNKEKIRRYLETKKREGGGLIHNLLRTKYGIENVHPRSEAFVEMGILPSGLAVSGDYDISYKDEKGKEFFVEVKTSNSGQIFFLSPDELEFAKNNSDKYKLFFVYDIDNNNPEKSKYYELPSKFWENDKYRKNEIIEKIEFNF